MIRLSKNAGIPIGYVELFLKALALNRLVQSELKIAQFRLNYSNNSYSIESR